MRLLGNESMSFESLEVWATLLLCATSFAWARGTSRRLQRIEYWFCIIAQKRHLSVALIVVCALGLRLAILPWTGIPLPFMPDDFSFLLAADTYAHGRLTNPTPLMWPHFESFHIDMVPTYMSMYFPGPGLVLAVGKILFGQAWFGLVFANAFMCASLYWMLEAYLPKTWALLGGFIALLHLALFSYWIDTYTGGGSIAAIAGALVLGALPRFAQHQRKRDAAIMGTGCGLLLITRPFEGFLLCIPITVLLMRWMFSKHQPRSIVERARKLVPAVAIVLATMVWLGFYNYRVFGSPTTLPYTIHRAKYGIAPYLVWQSPQAIPAYTHESMRHLYESEELGFYEKIHSPKLYIPIVLYRTFMVARFYAALPLLLPILMFPWVLRDSKMRFLLICCLFGLAAMLIEVFLLPHYLAPFTAAFYAVGLQGMRHVRACRPNGRRVGLAFVRYSIVVTVLLAGVRVWAVPLRLKLPDRQHFAWFWFGSYDFGVERNKVQNELEKQPGNQLAIVRYSPTHIPGNEWVYNRADINASKVIWARDMGKQKNQELLAYYPSRTVWLVQPDLDPVSLTQYSDSGTEALPRALQSTSVLK